MREWKYKFWPPYPTGPAPSYTTGWDTIALSHLDMAIGALHGRQAAAECAALMNAAAYRIVLGDLPGAHRAAADALQLTRSLGSEQLLIFSLQHLATVGALAGELRTAATLAGYVEACLMREGLAREPTEARTFEILTLSLEMRLPTAERNALPAVGATAFVERGGGSCLSIDGDELAATQMSG